MKGNKLGFWPLIENGENEFYPLFECAGHQTTHSRLVLERLSDSLYFLHGTGSLEKIKDFQIHCPICDAVLDLKVNGRPNQNDPVYGCHQCL